MLLRDNIRKSKSNKVNIKEKEGTRIPEKRRKEMALVVSSAS